MNRNLEIRLNKLEKSGRVLDLDDPLIVILGSAPLPEGPQDIEGWIRDGLARRQGPSVVIYDGGKPTPSAAQWIEEYSDAK